MVIIEDDSTVAKRRSEQPFFRERNIYYEVQKQDTIKKRKDSRKEKKHE